MFGILALVVFIIDFFVALGNLHGTGNLFTFEALTSLGLVFFVAHTLYDWRPWR